MAQKGTITAWLRKRISDLDYGYNWYGQVGHCNKNKAVLDHLQNKARLSYLSNRNLANHFSGEDTFYFAGNSRGPETLVMIDIDCHHGIGTLDGALAYAQFLKDTFFPNLYFEPSTNGKGAHGYFVVQKDKVKPEILNDLLGQLQAYLQQTIHGFDIENVEIKGRCPCIIWGTQRGEVANYKSGTLAKIPRDASRFDELKKTTTLSISELRALISKPLPQMPPIIKMAAISAQGITQAKSAITPVVASTTKVAAKPLLGEKKVASKVRKVAQIREMRTAVGSCSDKVISESELEKLNGHYLKVAQTLLGTHPLKAGRVVATALDLAILLMLLKWFTNHMNSDGSMPWARFKALWDALYEAGDITRAFDPKRFAAMRNYLSSLGLLDWQDKNYQVGHWVDGVKVGGRACQWKASEQLMGMLMEEEQREESTSLAGTYPATRLLQIIESLVMLPFERTIRPVDVTPTLFVHPTEQELRQAMGLAA